MNPKRLIYVMLSAAACLLEASSWRMNVQVQTAQVREKPSYLGKVVLSFPYGTNVQVLQTKGDWMEVKSAQGPSGWVHKSALTTKKVALAAGSGTGRTGASSDELALAGKGFNAEVEKDFKAKNKKLNFEAVDRMEKIKIAPPDMQAFLADGQIRPSEGGAQ